PPAPAAVPAPGPIPAPTPASPAPVRSKKLLPLIAAGICVVAAVVGYVLLSKSGSRSGTPADTGSPAGETAALPDAGLKPVSQDASKQADAKPKPAAAEAKAAETKPAEKKPAATAAESVNKPADNAPTPSGKPADRAAVDLPNARMIAARNFALQKRTDTASVFFVAAETLKRDGSTALAGNKFTDARCAFTVAEKIYRLYADDDDDADRMKALIKLVIKLREDATAAWNNIPADPLFREAQDRVNRGDAARAKNDFAVAAREYATAAFIYEKIRWAVGAALKK
ncbi:MAG: hypothetical protein ACYDH3_10760, partial [Candidatus Aminicenantales bacterium]